MKNMWPLFLAVFLFSTPARAETIVTHETEKYFFNNEKMEKFDGQYEYTYLVDLEKNTFVRTRVYDYQTKQITPDDTVYEIQSKLKSHPGAAARYQLKPVIRAVGSPDEDTVETLIVGTGEVTSVTSTGDTVVVSRAARLK